MNRRQIQRWVSWLLPLIVARAFVPVGFMVSVGEHGIDFVLCSGSGPVPHIPRADHASLHEHHGHQTDHTHPPDGSGSDGSSSGAPCLFAVSGAACATVAWAMPAAPEHLGRTPVLGSDTVDSAEPFLLDRIRGPPLA
jgi:hypothetical protein